VRVPFVVAAVTALTWIGPATSLSRQVDIVRTAHGVPHIRAENLRAAGFALAWVMSEDYGSRTARRVLSARGEQSRFDGRATLNADFDGLRARPRASATYHLLDQETRDVYDGFAAGLNEYITRHPSEFPPGMPTDFSGYDIATLDVGDPPPAARVRQFVAALTGTPPEPSPAVRDFTAGDEFDPDAGSNAWALAPGRTTSGRAILLRNPHLAWTAGYYEAHLTVPGVVDFYGDFRIGGPLTLIGGFNRYLGWATTNSSSADFSTEFYALDRDPGSPDRYLLDGASLPIAHESLSVAYQTDDAMASDTREYWSTPLGPVVYRTDTKIYVARTSGDGEFRAGEQFLRMMRARSLAEWKDAMRLRALITSNYTYADRAGNIFELWNGGVPLLPHPPGGDRATEAHETRDVWTRLIPFTALPQFLNPPGGYVHNENNSPQFGNLRRVRLENRYSNMEPPELDLRAQHAVRLLDNDRRLSLEDVIRLKHSYRMLLADRVKTDLLAAVERTRPTGETGSAVALLRRWDNSVAPGSRGGVLFEMWMRRYVRGRQGKTPFAVDWDPMRPVRTPRGLADPVLAAAEFEPAIEDTVKTFGRWDVAWGDVHRVRRGDVDVPVGGCSGQLGCFRVLGYARDPDGKLVANSGDGWILAVEFGDVPRAYSVLAYGESSKPDSPWFADQAAMFARGELKRVAFTARDVDRQAVMKYRPGDR
jgi:acyl-homoserine-lactone acylase